MSTTYAPKSTVVDVVDIAPSKVIEAFQPAGDTSIGDFDDLDMSPDDSALPLLTMNRKVGQDDSGILIGNERHLEVDFIWAAKSVTRAHFANRYDVDPTGRPDCWSADGTNPSPTVTEPKAHTCAGCPFSFEATGGGEANGTPGCSKNLEALVYVQDDTGTTQVARIRFGGIAFKAARAYWDSFRFARPKKYAFQYLTRMRLVSTKTDNGNFLVPEFSRVSELDREAAIAVGTDAKSMTGTFRSLVSTELIEGAVAPADDQAGPFDDPAGAPYEDAPTMAPDDAFAHLRAGPAVNEAERFPLDDEKF
jgi:hypothetical protein